MSLTRGFFGMPHNIIGQHSAQIMKMILNIILPAMSFVLTTAGLAIDWHYVALAAGSAVAGSLLLGYFRPEKTLGSQVNKMAMATIGGLIVGSAVVQYKGLISPSYVSLAYFVSAIGVLIVVRTFVGLFEANAGSLTTTLVQRIFNVKLERNENGEIHRTKGGRARHNRKDIRIENNPTGQPSIVIDSDAKPDEVRVIEQTIVDQKKEK
jgi:hypothetical protein